MAFSKSALKAEIISAMNAAFAVSDPDDRTTAIDAYAEALAAEITTQIRDAINGTTVIFTLTAPNGPVTGTISLTSSNP